MAKTAAAGFGSAASRARPERRAQIHQIRQDIIANSILQIDHNALLARLEEVKSVAGDDIARIIELLLLENQILQAQTAKGFWRGIPIKIDEYPRFIELVETEERTHEKEPIVTPSTDDGED